MMRRMSRSVLGVNQSVQWTRPMVQFHQVSYRKRRLAPAEVVTRRQDHYLTWGMGSPDSSIYQKPRKSWFQILLARPGLIGTVIGFLGGLGGLLWWAHDRVEITGRSGFTALLEEEKESILSVKDPRGLMVQRVLSKIVRASQYPELKQLYWEVAVIDSDTANAMVLPGGKVIFYTGILPIANSEEMVAAILAHEIGHILARHSAESVSNQLFLKACQLMGSWIFGINISNIGPQMLYTLPHSRMMEAEADYISVLLLLRAGYDPENAVELWKRFGEAMGNDGWDIASTHPSGPKRIINIEKAIPHLRELELADKATLDADDIKLA